LKLAGLLYTLGTTSLFLLFMFIIFSCDKEIADLLKTEVKKTSYETNKALLLN